MKIAIYARVSTSDQVNEGYSIPAQIDLLKEYSIINKYTVLTIYEDAGISGKNIKDRPALKRLLKECNKYDAILVWKLSRLSRSLSDLLFIVNEFKNHNVSLISYSEKFDTSTPIGKMLLHMLGSIAEFERDTIVENVKMGMNERFKQGYSKGAIPFGYKSIDKEAVIDSKQSKAVKYCFETYNNSLDGKCITELAGYLNKQGFKTRRGKEWDRYNIRDMFRNPFYVGMVRSGYHSRGHAIKKDACTIEGKHESIISKNLFEAVNTKLDSKKFNHHREKNNDSLLTGLIDCPYCNSKLFSLSTYNTNHKGEKAYKIKMYRCTSTKNGLKKCKGFYFVASKAEPQVLELIQKLSKNIELIKVETKTDNSLIENIAQNIAEKNKIKQKYFDLFEGNKLSIELFSERLNQIIVEIEELEKEKQKELNKAKPVDIISNIKKLADGLNVLTPAEQKELIRNIVSKVVMNGKKKLVKIILLNGFEVIYDT